MITSSLTLWNFGVLIANGMHDIKNHTMVSHGMIYFYYSEISERITALWPLVDCLAANDSRTNICLPSFAIDGYLNVQSTKNTREIEPYTD